MARRGSGRAGCVNDGTLVRSTVPKYKEETSGKRTQEPEMGRHEDRVKSLVRARVVCHKASVCCILTRSDH